MNLSDFLTLLDEFSLFSSTLYIEYHSFIVILLQCIIVIKGLINVSDLLGMQYYAFFPILIHTSLLAYLHR